MKAVVAAAGEVAAVQALQSPVLATFLVRESGHGMLDCPMPCLPLMPCCQQQHTVAVTPRLRLLASVHHLVQVPTQCPSHAHTHMRAASGTPQTSAMPTCTTRISSPAS